MILSDGKPRLTRDLIILLTVCATLVLSACAGAPTSDDIPEIQINQGKSFSQITHAHRDLYFEELVANSIKNTNLQANEINEHLRLKLAQIISGFLVSRSELAEFDQRLKRSNSGDIVTITSDVSLLSEIEGANTYRALATDQLVADIIYLKSLSEGSTKTVTTSTGSAVLAALKARGTRAQLALDWFTQRGQSLTPAEHLALQPFAEVLDTLAPDAASIQAIHQAYFLDPKQLVEIERNSSEQQNLISQGKLALLHADQEMRNWVAHFAKARLDSQNEFEYYPTVVGRKHRSTLRGIASESPAGFDRASHMAQHESPIRPLTARSLNENDFVLIYSGKLQSTASLRLISALGRQKRPATFFLDTDDLVLTGSHSMPSLTLASPWPAGFKLSQHLNFATQGDSQLPPCLQNNSELELSMVKGRTTLQTLRLPMAPFLRPGFDAESGRLGKLARDQHLRLVRTNIASFDQIDFDPKHVAERVIQQISKLKTGLIELHANSPRSLKIQEELNEQVNRTFKNGKSAPRFIALSAQLGEA